MQLPRPQHRGQPAWRDIGHADALQQSASRHSGAMRKHRARNREVPGSLRAPERRTGPVNAFLTINWAKIAELKKLSCRRTRKTGDYPWTPVRCLTFETVVLRPPRIRLAPVTGIRGGKQQPWSMSRRVRAERRRGPDFRVSVKSAPS